MGIYRRIYKQGNSLVISLPVWMVQQLGVDQGDYLRLEFQANLNRCTLSPATADQVALSKYNRVGKSPPAGVVDDIRKLNEEKEAAQSGDESESG